MPRFGGSILEWMMKARDETFAIIPKPLRKRVLASFRFRFTTDGDDDEKVSPGFANVKNAPDDHSYFFLLGDAKLVKDPVCPVKSDNLEYLIIPPANASPNHRLAIAGRREAPSLWPPIARDLADVFGEDDSIKAIKDRLGLWRDYPLKGAVGDWTIILLATNVSGEESRLRRVQGDAGC